MFCSFIYLFVCKNTSQGTIREFANGAQHLALLPCTVLKHDCPPSPFPCWPALTFLQSNHAWARSSHLIYGVRPIFQILNRHFLNLVIKFLVCSLVSPGIQAWIFPLLFIHTLYAAVCLNSRWILHIQSWRCRYFVPVLVHVHPYQLTNCALGSNVLRHGTD